MFALVLAGLVAAAAPPKPAATYATVAGAGAVGATMLTPWAGGLGRMELGIEGWPRLAAGGTVGLGADVWGMAGGDLQGLAIGRPYGEIAWPMGARRWVRWGGPVLRLGPILTRGLGDGAATGFSSGTGGVSVGNTLRRSATVRWELGGGVDVACSPGGCWGMLAAWGRLRRPGGLFMAAELGFPHIVMAVGWQAQASSQPDAPERWRL